MQASFYVDDRQVLVFRHIRAPFIRSGAASLQIMNGSEEGTRYLYLLTRVPRWRGGEISRSSSAYEC